MTMQFQNTAYHSSVKNFNYNSSILHLVFFLYTVSNIYIMCMIYFPGHISIQRDEQIKKSFLFGFRLKYFLIILLIGNKELYPQLYCAAGTTFASQKLTFLFPPLVSIRLILNLKVYRCPLYINYVSVVITLK